MNVNQAVPQCRTEMSSLAGPHLLTVNEIPLLYYAYFNFSKELHGNFFCFALKTLRLYLPLCDSLRSVFLNIETYSISNIVYTKPEKNIQEKTFIFNLAFKLLSIRISGQPSM
jgi:hypothetical protein